MNEKYGTGIPVLGDESVVAKLVTTDRKEYETRCCTKVGALRFIAKYNVPIAKTKIFTRLNVELSEHTLKIKTFFY